MTSSGNYNDERYINYLPATRPSKEYIEFGAILDAIKKGWDENKTIDGVRKDFADLKLEISGAIKDTKNTKLSTFTIKSGNANNNNNDIRVHKIEYNGSNTNNGAIIEVHGGGYCTLGSYKNFGFAEILSKLTGCCVFALDYKLSPEYVLPNAVNELVILYQYLLKNLHIPSTKIAMTGDSAGGGMVLLALQSMKYGANQYRNLPQPSCVWLNSAWTNLANDNPSNSKNEHVEVMMAYPRLHHMAGWSVGNIDGELNKIGNNDKKNEIYSPQFGRFDGLAPMYFMVGQDEMILDDSVLCAKKAFEAGVDVRCDVDPYMCHAWGSMPNAFPEGLVACSKACDWILQQFKKQGKRGRAKL